MEKYGRNSEFEAKILLATLDGITIDYVTGPNIENLMSIESHLTNKYV